MLGGHFQVVFLKVLGVVSTTVDPIHTQVALSTL